MAIVMPQTAEQAHAVARQHYRAMLTHAAAGRDNMTATAAACFQNAAHLAVMYEARQIRLSLRALLNQRVSSVEDERDWHPPVPDVPHDGWPVNTARRPR